MEIMSRSNRVVRFIGKVYRRKNFINTEIRRIKQFALSDILQDSLARLTFKKYLRNKYNYGTKIILMIWETYNICSKIQLKALDLSDIIINKLQKACPEYTEEGFLVIQLKEYKRQENENMINQVLNDIKSALIVRMEDCYAYRMFIYDLREEREKVRQCIGEIHDMLEGVKDELSDFLMDIMSECLQE